MLNAPGNKKIRNRRNIVFRFKKINNQKTVLDDYELYNDSGDEE